MTVPNGGARHSSQFLKSGFVTLNEVALTTTVGSPKGVRVVPAMALAILPSFIDSRNRIRWRRAEVDEGYAVTAVDEPWADLPGGQVAVHFTQPPNMIEGRGAEQGYLGVGGP